MTHFENRQDAGRQLAARLLHLKEHRNVIVLGIPRGGVVVAAEIAHALNAPLDVLITHKLGAPFNPELAMGAVASDGTVWLDEPLIMDLGISRQAVERERERQMREIMRRAELYRRGRPPEELRGKTAILCDDGVATGSTTLASLHALTRCEPAWRVLAVPVAPASTARMLRAECDELVLIDTPSPSVAVGLFYDDFEQVSDEEVIELLDG